jgi:cytochrome c
MKPPSRTVLSALFSSALLASFSTAALADQALAQAKNCMACHQVAVKVVGPSYKDVAKKYASDKNAAAMLATKIMKGGSGVWGPVPMPANPQVSEAEAKKLAAWVLSQK